MKKAVIILIAISLAGCASTHRAYGDPDQPHRVCPSTTIGSEAKTFCY